MWSLLRRLAVDENVTTFLSSHDSHEIRSLCNEISVIARGRLVYTGATRDLGADLDAFEQRLIRLLTYQGCADRRNGMASQRPTGGTRPCLLQPRARHL